MLNIPFQISIDTNKEICLKNSKYTNQRKICHINQKNMPNKTPSTSSQSKEYAKQNTKYAKDKDKEAQGGGANIALFLLIKC